MDIQIHSAESVRQLFENPACEITALISIANIGAEHPKLKYEPTFRLNLSFNDVLPSDIDYESCGKHANRLFFGAHADRIAAFVYDIKDFTETIICQCHFGHSRSAAVAAAIKEHFTGNGIAVFSDDNYSPNKYVFRLTLAALNRRKQQH